MLRELCDLPIIHRHLRLGSGAELLVQQQPWAEREVLEAECRARRQEADSRISHAQALPAAHRRAAFLTGNRASLAVEEEGFQQALRAYHQQHYRLSQIVAS